MKSKWQTIADLASEVSSSTQRKLESASEQVVQAKKSVLATSDVVLERVSDIAANGIISTLTDTASARAKNITNQGVSTVGHVDKLDEELTIPKIDIPTATIIDDSTDTSSAVKDVEDTINKLQGGDRVGHAGQAILTIAGGASGVAASGAIASAAGASTLLGSTSLAGVLGGVFVTATPVGWVVGAAIAGSAAAYGVSKLVRSGGRQDRLRQEISNRLSKRLSALRSKGIQQSALEQLQHSITYALKSGHLSSDQAQRMLGLVENGKLDPELALSRVRTLLKEAECTNY
jgi:hypothetical protein